MQPKKGSILSLFHSPAKLNHNPLRVSPKKTNGFDRVYSKIPQAWMMMMI